MIFDKLTLSPITAILGFGIWNIQRFMEDRKNAHAKLLKQDSLVPALYAEIDFNTTDMEIVSNEKPVTARVAQGDGGAGRPYPKYNRRPTHMVLWLTDFRNARHIR